MKNSNEKSGKEKREFERIPITAKVTRIDEGKNDFYFTKDLSVGGIYLETNDPLPIGTIVELEISVHGFKDLIKIKGKVARVQEKNGKVHGVGVQFVDIDDPTAEELEKLVSEESK